MMEAKADKQIDGIDGMIRSLNSLYEKYGYRQYKMSKFEEYSLYGKNIDFLVSDRVITFTDTDGKLMALKPDVTLSIVKNTSDDADAVTKVCYNENVYRVSEGSGAFKEIMQSGLECIGEVDECLVGEVISLALRSLDLTGKRCVIELSHLGILSSALDAATDDGEVRRRLLECVGNKNLHGAKELLSGVESSKSALLFTLMNTYGAAVDVMKKLSSLGLEGEGKDALSELETVLSYFDKEALSDKIRIDFSVTADENYYNGIVFKGFAESVPDSVLSGGQYDKLMRKMGKRSRAVGFAVYLDMLERLYTVSDGYDFDVMLVYGDASPAEVAAKTDAIVTSGKSVYSCKTPCEAVKCRSVIEM
ncbi:MAG: ATP phosphoribosyltransferase regulatory subunit [Clostridia bacterium]|nr:ATP phosphoribosyltransferase regulatory subunit [Clostridia bacterium]